MNEAPITNQTPAAAPHVDVATPSFGFEPADNFSGDIPSHARATESGPVELEQTGLTSHPKQGSLFASELIWKAAIAAKLREAGDYELANGLDECHSLQSFARCRGCSTTRTFWNRCDRFYCPVCAPRLSRERKDTVEWWSKSISQPKHVVLTARNTDTLTFHQVKRFKLAITKLRRTKFARNWRGGMWSLEVTKEDKGWHLHAHLLVDATFIDAQQLAIIWGRLMGQDFAIVCVKDARQHQYLHQVTKYTVKGSQLAQWTGEDILTFILAIHGQRTFGVFGSLYGKRTEWREWLNELSAHGKLCKCGCTEWQVYSESEYEFYLASNPTIAAIPPPQLPDLRQLSLTTFKTPPQIRHVDNS